MVSQDLLFVENQFLYGLHLSHPTSGLQFVVIAGHLNNESSCPLPPTLIPSLLKLENERNLGSLMTVLIGDFNRPVEILRPLESPPLSFQILLNQTTDRRCSYFGTISSGKKLIDNVLVKNLPTSIKPQVDVETSVLFTHPVMRLTIPLVVVEPAAFPRGQEILNRKLIEEIKLSVKANLDNYPFLNADKFISKAVDAVYSILRKRKPPPIDVCAGVKKRREAISTYVKNNPSGLDLETITGLWSIRYEF